MPATATTDAHNRPRALTTMGRRGCVVPGQTWVSRQRAFAQRGRGDNVCNGCAFHVVRRLYRAYLFIGSTSSTRTAGTRSCRWLPRASVPLPYPPLPFRPMRAQACACVRGRMHASAYETGTRRGRPCRSGSRRCPRSAPRCCGRSPPPGTAVPPVSTQSTPWGYSEYPQGVL
jgi:hypothetical protein